MVNTDISKNLCMQLVAEVKERIGKLKEYGMSEKEIASVLQSEQTLLKMTIDRNHRIYLGDNRIEVRMEPLVRAVYLLFLRHPEGIVFKELPDYGQELKMIYAEIRPWGLTDRAFTSIEDVTDPMRNSINEKCARIKKVFVSFLGSRMAELYFIRGERGGIKKISLPRDLVVWE